MDEPSSTPQISVFTGICVGLAASFVQSLGLTIQRKSHLHNEAQPGALRRPDHRRPLWCFGFAIFISSNLLGTVFQVGALPLVVLGPLGAVSLLYNAFFANIILGDQFSIQLIAGTVLIAGGAVLIGIFGVVPEQTTHTLDELVAYYTRTPFIVWISLLSLALAAVLALAHVTEWTAERSTLQASLTPRTPRHKRFRRWSQAARAPPLPPQPAFVPATTPALGREARYGTFGRQDGEDGEDGAQAKVRPELRVSPGAEGKGGAEVSGEAIERSRLMVGVAYGGASGTLSGLCLLFAKTGIELLILTVVGQNQFGHVEAWIIVLVLLVAALLQLFYLNRALRLVGPTLICPLAFCFYNLSSIISGLVYYDQMDQLSTVQIALVTLGTAILLAGVWIVSIKKDPDQEETVPLCAAGEQVARFTDEPEEAGLLDQAVVDDDDQSDDEEPVQWLPRGLTIGIGAASPGFDLRPARRRATLHVIPNSPPAPPDSPATERSPLFPQHHLLATVPDADADRAAHLRRLVRERGRTKSLSGGVYVGRTSFEGEREQHVAVPGLGLPFDAGAAGEGHVFAEGREGGRADEAGRGGGAGGRRKVGWGKQLKARFAQALGGAGQGRG